MEWTKGFQAVAFCEIDQFCQKVLAKHWPGVPCYPDLKTLKGDEVENIDIIAAGFPCQPFSLAGSRGGDKDPRHLWPEVARIIRTVRPRYVLLENVPGHLSLGFGRVLGDLAKIGYDAEWQCIQAADVGAAHRRERVFIVAYPQGEQRHVCANPQARKVPQPRDRHRTALSRKRWQPHEPPFCRGIDGLPNRVDRLRALGNAVVPAVAQFIGEQILAAEAHA